jgi:hypothetical protein
MSRSEVSIDEGGVRLQAGAERRYVPFADIADVELRTRMLRDPAVEVVLRSGEQLSLFVGASALEIHGGLVEHMAGQRRATSATARGFGRDRRSLIDWLSAVSDSAVSSGYREAAGGTASPFEVAEDENGDVEARAAAIHVLARLADGDELVRVAKLLLGRTLPPIVQVAARLAPGGWAFVSDGVLDAAMPFLDAADREEARSLLREPVPFGPAGPERDLGHAAAEARRQLDEDARARTSSPPDAHGRARTALSMSDRDTSRWIGRSWGL